jgi:hypothetical protein
MRAAAAFRRALCLSAFLVVTSATAQERPNFSGEWLLEQRTGDLGDFADQLIVRQWMEGWISPVTGKSGAFEFIAIDRRIRGQLQSSQRQIGIAGGIVGPVVAESHGGGPGPSLQTRFSTHWDGTTLVMENGSYRGWPRESGPYSEYREAWSLDGAALRVAITTQDSTGKASTAALVYMKR